MVTKPKRAVKRAGDAVALPVASLPVASLFTFLLTSLLWLLVVTPFGASLEIARIQTHNTSTSGRVFEFLLLNTDGPETTLSWTFEPGDSTIITSQSPLSLAPGGSADIFISHVYSSPGTYTPQMVLTSLTGEQTISQQFPLTVDPFVQVIIADLQDSGLEHVLEILILNKKGYDLSNLFWELRVENQTLSSTEPLTVLDNGSAAVILPYVFPRAKTYDLSAAVVNEDFREQASLTLAVECASHELDEDNDGYKSALCGFNDCDDTSKKIYLGAPEICG
ncbi:hypothetical protein COY95_00030, partial [Candidatus Woesearchaeota archaeon CG_4_10_14_0_8_um_filter_47_5]